MGAILPLIEPEYNGFMPIYEYACQNCGHRFEELIRGDEQPACPSCGASRLERQFSAAAAHATGSGTSECPARHVCGAACCHGGKCGD